MPTITAGCHPGGGGARSMAPHSGSEMAAEAEAEDPEERKRRRARKSILFNRHCRVLVLRRAPALRPLHPRPPPVPVG